MHVIPLQHSVYPTLLKQTYDPPKKLYARGDVSILERSCLAVIGSRHPTAYGTRVTRNLVSQLVPDFCIVSGLAIGIDALAHETALYCGGVTIAVLGSSVDDESIAPRTNKLLAQQILTQGGCLLSEYAPPTHASRTTFPARNRIIAGLSSGVLVIEAGAKSGTHITARIALSENRDVFAVPGNIDNPNARGTNELIQRGAYPVTSGQDIRVALSLPLIPKKDSHSHVPHLDNEQSQSDNTIAKVMKTLQRCPCTLEQLIQETQLDPRRVIQTISELELSGILRKNGALLTLT